MLCLNNPRENFQYLTHKCNTRGCHAGCVRDALPRANDEGVVYSAVVVDGVQTLSGVACASRGCPHPPLTSRRFCRNHEHLEGLCAAHTGPGQEDYCMNPCTPGNERNRSGNQTCNVHAQIEREYGGPLPPMYEQHRRPNERQEEYMARHNAFWRERKKHR